MKPRRSLQDMIDRLHGREPSAAPVAPVPAPLVPVEAARPPAARKREQLARVEQNLYGKAGAILEAAVSTFDLTDDELRAKGPPQRWIDELDGDERAAREKFHVAREARLSKREAPVALDIAEKVHTNGSRIKAMQKQRDIPLGAIVVQMSVPLPQYEVRQVVDTTGEDQEWLDE